MDLKCKNSVWKEVQRAKLCLETRLELSVDHVTFAYEVTYCSAIASKAD